MKINNQNTNGYQIILPIIFLIITSCVHNYEPVITSLISKPNTIIPGGSVYLECVAIDDDQSNMLKSDDIYYEWIAAHGILLIAQDTIIENVRDTNIFFDGDMITSIIGDTIIFDADSLRLWIAPQDEGYYSITCTVSDLFGGYDSKTINVRVE
tara:strand:+ start:212 stop:673 length:462 start_codon:yes stop_codon:yes gene_type:complete